MKKPLTYIIFLFFIFKSFAAIAATPDLPDDFKGLNTRLRLQELAENGNNDDNLLQKLSIMYEIGNYFNNKYPNNEIFEENFDEKLKPFFPDADDYLLRKYANLLRSGVMIYRLGRHYYNIYVSQKLMPKSYKVVHSTQDFDSPDEVSYIEAPTGKFTKVYNFKKFLTYSSNPEERKAIENYQKAQVSKDSIWGQFEIALSQLEWKKLLLYGEEYKNPLLSEFGVGEAVESDSMQVRLLSNATTIDGQKEFYIGLQIITSDNSFVLANNLSTALQKPQIDLRGSENLENYQVIYPAPQSTVSTPFVYKYFGNFIIPLKVQVKDINQPLQIQARATIVGCQSNLSCFPETFRLSLTVMPGQDYSFANGYQNYFQQQLNILPADSPQYFKLEKFVVDNDSDGQSLRLEFSTAKKTENFKVFIEDKDSYTSFAAPYISIQDNKIFVRFEPMQKNTKLNNSEYVITAVFNGFDAYRTTRLPASATLFDTQTASLNLGFLLLALVGGFILNFMPCVFPVLSLKIITLSRADSLKKKKLKKSLWLTVAGIFSGFTLLIILLSVAKFAGYSLGWGMQYQNMTFLIAMAFLLTACILILPYLLNSKVLNLSNSDSNKIGFLLGNLIVLLSTPCTGPYLATAIGFALGGSYTDLIFILYAVALGLSAPYLLALCLNNPQTLIPSTGCWQEKLQLCMQIMLLLTIIWFLTLVYNQTGIGCVSALLFSLLLFALLLKLYQKFTIYLDGVFDERITLKSIMKSRKIAAVSLIAYLVINVTLLCFYAEKTHLANLVQYSETRPTLIDKKLIAQKLAAGKSVLLEIGADWCLTCHYNNVMTLNRQNLKYWQETYNLDFVQVDWTNYNQDILNFMAKYGRKGLPFYVLYTPLLRDGLVLPEIFSAQDFENIIRNSALR